MPDGIELVADRWYPTPPRVRRRGRPPCSSARRTAARSWARSAGCARSAATRSSCRAAGGRSGRAASSCRCATSGGRAGDAQLGGGAALVRRPPRHVGRELPRHDAVGRGPGCPGLREGAQLPGHRGELPRLGRVPRGSVRARDGAGLDPRDHAPGARMARRAARPPARRPDGVDLECRPAPRERRRRRHRGADGLLPGLARPQRPGRPVVGRRRLRAPAGEGAAGQLHRRLVRPLPQGTGGRLRGPPAGRADRPPDHRPLDPRQPRPVRRDRARRAALVRQPARPGRGRATGRAGAPLRHGVAHLAGVLAVATGGGDRALVSRSGRHADADPAEGRARVHRTATTSTRTIRRRPWAGRRSTCPRRGARTSVAASGVGTCSPTPAPCSPRTSRSSAR